MGKLNEAAQVSTIGSEYVLLTDSNGLPVRISKNNLAEVIRSVMNEATTEKNGLKPAGDRAATLFFMSINRSGNSVKAPAIIFNRIGGASVPPTPRFKIWHDESTGNFKIILERTEYTPSIYAKILLSNLPSTDAIPLSVANQDEVDAA